MRVRLPDDARTIVLGLLCVDHGSDIAREAASRREREALLRFWETLQSCTPQIDAAVERTAASIPAFAAVLASMPPEVREQQRIRSRELQRAAIIDGEWEPYVADLRAQGRVYATMGIPFHAWFALIAAFRAPVHDAVIHPEDREAQRVLEGMSTFLDRAIATIGEAYVTAKADLVREAEARLRQYVDLVHAAPLGMEIWRWDSPPDPLSFRLVAFNPAAARMAEGAESLMIDATIDQQPLGVRVRPKAERMADCAQAGETREWTGQGSGTPPRVLRARAFPLAEDYVGTILEDVSERERMRESILRHVHDLERSNRELDEFAYVASHDLKSPLQDIRNLAGWIEEDGADALPPECRRHMALLVDRIRRMERLLDDLLEYSRVGREDGTAALVDLSDVVDEVVQLLGPPAGFTVSTSCTVAAVRLMRVPFENVLRNLIGNAIKHHDRGGGRVVVEAKRSGSVLEVAVIDDGPGIAPEFHARVFRMFQTLKPRDEIEGSGVGLAIVKKTVERYGGTITVSSRGRGTTMRFTWPIDAGPLADSDASS